MKILDSVGSKIKFGFLKYSLGLVLTKGKKSCPKMALTLGICHDCIYRFLLKANSFLPLLPSVMIAIVKSHATVANPGYLIIDETFSPSNLLAFLRGFLICSMQPWAVKNEV